MKYTKEDAKKKLEKAVADLKNNPRCDISDEELERRYAALCTDDNLDILSRMLTALEEERKK